MAGNEVAERLYTIRRLALARGDMNLAGEAEQALMALGLPFTPPEPEVEAAVPAELEEAVPPKPRRGRPPKART
jgi:hypothetical protein